MGVFFLGMVVGAIVVCLGMAIYAGNSVDKDMDGY